MKSIANKKLVLKKVTTSTHQIFGASNANPSQDDNTDSETLSSAFHDPTESQINPRVLSQNAEICL
ncbi:hypothetical protein [Kordia sp.]|uniref:hypothetical protein n=1 Tax=Kordia sp. TaxID=1965332 RepID=UPI0025BE7775|nr:hypothetical protein [Kordia sp.]MCH2192627.1 hypothetical protein [Kordia sp.]